MACMQTKKERRTTHATWKYISYRIYVYMWIRVYIGTCMQIHLNSSNRPSVETLIRTHIYMYIYLCRYSSASKHISYDACGYTWKDNLARASRPLSGNALEPIVAEAFCLYRWRKMYVYIYLYVYMDVGWENSGFSGVYSSYEIASFIVGFFLLKNVRDSEEERQWMGKCRPLVRVRESSEKELPRVRLSRRFYRDFG